jgi:hypothetical protein
VPATQPTTADLGLIRQHVALASESSGGVFRRTHLVAWGIEPTIVRAMTRRGWWTRLHHGVYTDADRLAPDVPSADRHATLCAAAIMALPNPAYAFGPCSGALHELPLDRGLPDRLELVRPLGSDQRALQRRITSATSLADVTVHSHALAERHVTEVRGIPVVSRDLAAVSSAAQSTPEWAVIILDAVAWQRSAGVDELRDLTEDWPRLRGIGTVRRALPLVRAGAQTPLETLSRLRLVRAGLPEPELQVPYYDDVGLIGFVDMTWRSWRVIGEADGAVKYASRDDLVAEKVREDRLRRRGYAVVRWTWDEIWRDPARVAARVLEARRVSSAGAA